MPEDSRNPFLEARKAGLSPIPVDVTTKKPRLSWKRYQESVADIDECIAWHERGWQIGIVCGEISGRLVAIDFEAAFMPQLAVLIERLRTAGIWDTFKTWTQGYTESTPKGGLHVLVHVAGDLPVEGNTRLAVARNGHPLIETRGEGGYVIVAPSPGYELLDGSFEKIAWAAAEEWWLR